MFYPLTTLSVSLGMMLTELICVMTALSVISFSSSNSVAFYVESLSTIFSFSSSVSFDSSFSSFSSISTVSIFMQI